MKTFRVLGEAIKIPVPKEPLAALQLQGRKLPQALSIAEIRQKVRRHLVAAKD